MGRERENSKRFNKCYRSFQIPVTGSALVHSFPVFRTRILGSIHVTPDAALDPALFVSDLQDANKNYFFQRFRLLLF